MNILNNTLKATWIATFLFWSQLSSELLELRMLPFIFMSSIPIFVCCFLVTFFTIFPFFSIDRQQLDNKDVFNKFFPYWAIMAFGICFYGIHSFNYDEVAVSFFSTAFFTSMCVWAWSSKTVKADWQEIKNTTS